MKIEKAHLNEKDLGSECRCDDCGSYPDYIWVIRPTVYHGRMYLCNDCIQILHEKTNRLRLLVVNG